MVMFYLLMPIALIAQMGLNENGLVNELGCGNCHSGVQTSQIIKNRAPDLNYSGLKYNEAYLFNYLESPQTVRNHIGKSRMPNFKLSTDEAYALTLYLMTKKTLPKGRELTTRKYNNKEDAFTLIDTEYQCTTCHSLNGAGINKSIDLTIAGTRLQADWLFDIILKPSAYVQRASPMPTFFNEDQASTNTVSKMVGYLMEKGKTKLYELEKNYTAVKKSNPKITPDMGRDIFLSQNCMACHVIEDEASWFETHNGPDLSAQKMRTQPAWLKQYLKETQAIRPNGYFPGTGSRMPNFNLSETEVKTLTDWLGTATLKTKLQPISTFQSRKVKRLLNDFLSCLGCHELNGIGGQIGPNLSNVGNRISDGFIKMAIQAPHMVMPESIMPKMAMDPKLMTSIQSFFAYQTSTEKSNYLNLIKNRPYPIGNQYTANCAPCHGPKGEGNGFNAAYLEIKPGNLADDKLMEQRSDAALFNTIYGGGRIMNKSHFMPAWGQKISREEIANHVARIRDFCDCSPPDWSKD